MARDAAKAAEGTGEAGRVETAKEKENERTTGQARAENRARRFEGIKVAQAEAEAQKNDTESRPLKRKAEDEGEDGEVPRTAADVESGEVVEAASAQLGEEFEEVIQDGRTVKVRRQE